MSVFSLSLLIPSDSQVSSPESHYVQVNSPDHDWFIVPMHRVTVFIIWLFVSDEPRKYHIPSREKYHINNAEQEWLQHMLLHMYTAHVHVAKWFVDTHDG